MALFEDKRKPVNIYADGTPTRKAQDRMNANAGRGLQRLADTADTFAGGAGVRQIGRGLQTIAKPITDPYKATKERQKIRANNREINAMVGDE